MKQVKKHTRLQKAVIKGLHTGLEKSVNYLFPGTGLGTRLSNYSKKKTIEAADRLGYDIPFGGSSKKYKRKRGLYPKYVIFFKKMNVYYELLTEYGIQLDPSELVSEKNVVETGVTVDPDDHDYPDWGNHVLMHVNDPHSLHPLAIDYKYEQQIFFKKIHRYSRYDRFRFTLYQLLNLNGHIPRSVQFLVATELKSFKVSKSKIWNQIRCILKRHQLRRYYNMVPHLIHYCCHLPIDLPKGVVQTCLDQFKLMDQQFSEHLQYQWKRSYFPNLRYIALKLCHLNGVIFHFSVPLIRTSRKKTYLNELFNDFKINKP